MHARLQRDALYRVARREWVAIVAVMIHEGPELAGARAQAAIFDYSMGTVPANRRRPAGRRSLATVKNVLREASNLFGLINSLSLLPACEAWTAVPALEMPHMPKGGYEVVAPRVEVVRQAFQTINTDIHTRLGVASIEEELDALNGLSDSMLVTRGLWRPMRDRVLLVLMALTGGRLAAIGRLSRGDYVRDHVGPPPDSRRGPMLGMNPQKGLDFEEFRSKPIPEQVGLLIDSYLVVIDRINAYRGRPPADSSTRLVVSRPSYHGKGARPEWISRRVSGRAGKERPLVPRAPYHLPDHVSLEEAAYGGYTPHEYRHFASQAAEAAGHKYNKRYPVDGPLVNPPPSYYAAALLDNGGVENDMRALYGDRTGTAMLEVVAGRATEGIWEILSTDVGERKRPDLEAYGQQLIRLRQIEDEEKRLERAARRFQSIPAGPDRLGLSSHDEGGNDDPQEVLRRGQEYLIGLVQELKDELRESASIIMQLQQLSQQKADTITLLNMFRLDEATWLAVPDSEPPGAEKVDWEQLDKGTLGKGLMPGSPLEAVREWLTFGEFCREAEIARSTATRWTKGEHLPTRPERRPWEPEWVPVDDSLGIRWRRIWVPGVKDTFWGHRLRRDRLAKTLTQWPQEPGWTTKDGEPTERCLKPICVPAPAARQITA
jgi:hypothetical protein